MKTKKAYGLWRPDKKKIHPREIFETAAEARMDIELGEHLPWSILRFEGYRVIPVTITYEEPEVVHATPSRKG